MGAAANKRRVEMVELIDFLHARINEDEQAAREASHRDYTEWRAQPNRGYIYAGPFEPGDEECGIPETGYTVVYDEGCPSVEEADHIARHDPARVLREIETKRAILAQEEEARAHYDHIKSSATRPVDISIGHVVALATVIRHLAAVYSDHPDYNPEWAS